ncbi:MAG: hypothetical protein IJY56_00935 [Clostridia bacterium]|nr:hypothetical protein [Clostridia bacterium]
MSEKTEFLRPGVYVSRGEIFSRGAKGRSVFIISGSAEGDGKIFEAVRGKTPFEGNESQGDLAVLCAAALENGAAKVYAACPGGDMTLQLLLDEASAREDVAAVLCTVVDAAEAVCKSCASDSAAGRERICVIAADSLESAQSLAGSLNSERAVVTGQSVSFKGVSSYALAGAAVAGAVCEGYVSGRTLTGRMMDGISVDDQLRDAQVVEAISCGITVVENTPKGAQIVRAVTSRTTVDGMPDNSYRDLSVVTSADKVIAEVRQMLSERLAFAKNNADTRRAISSQTVILLEEKLRQGLIDDYEVPCVTADKDDPSVCILPLTFTPACALCSISVSASVRL